MAILTAAELAQISAHKYAPGSYTPIDLIFYKYIWDPTLSLIPLWMAPNLITLLGTIVISIAVLTLLLVQEPHSLCFWFLTFATFIYQTLDAVDGRQARRTGSSSPLGQLFDHGCDCLVSSLLAAALAVTLGLEATPLAVAFLFCGQIPFFLGQWCEHFTGTLHTNLGGLYGTTEAQLTIMAVFASTAVFGQSFWDERLPGGFEKLTYKWLFVFIVFSNSVVITGNFLKKTFLAAFKSGLVWTAVKQLVPMGVLVVSAFGLRHIDRIWALGIFGLACVKCSVEIIVSTVSGREFPNFFASHGPVLLLALLEWGGSLSEADLKFGCAYVFVAVGVGLFGFCVRVTREISTHLGIRVFKIKPKTA